MSDVDKLVHATSHAIVRLNSKRLEQSPFHERYADDGNIYGLYANRLYPMHVGGDPVAHYWKLRHSAMLYDVPEKPLEIEGPDAVRLLEKVFTRRVSTLKPWRCRYAIACTPAGGIVMDGILIRFAEDRFWYIHANGDFRNWLLAHSDGLDVSVTDPKSRVLQIQGPKSLDILNRATVGEAARALKYFHAGLFDMAGQSVLVSRTGWTGELGFEVYTDANTDALGLWDHLMRCGADFGMEFGSTESMGFRRIEAGILDYGTDIDISMTPFEAGLGPFVDFSKPDFVGRTALEGADRECLLLGLVCQDGVPRAGDAIMVKGERTGVMKVGDWSPFLKKGIGFAHMFEPIPGGWIGEAVTLYDRDGNEFDAEIVPLPFYDSEKKIPRGLAPTGSA